MEDVPRSGRRARAVIPAEWAEWRGLFGLDPHLVVLGAECFVVRCGLCETEAQAAGIAAGYWESERHARSLGHAVMVVREVHA